MSRRRLVIVVLLAVSMAVLFLLARLPTVLERVAVFKLEGLGATDISFELVDVSLTSAKLGELRFVLEKNSRRYSISSRDISVSYILLDLLRGNLNTVDAPEISVRVEVLSDSQDESAELNIPPPSDWLASIPFKHFNLKHLEIELFGVSGTSRYVEIDGALNVAQKSANAQFDIKISDYGTQRFELSLTPTGMSRLVLSDMRMDSTPLTYVTLTSGAWTSTDGQLKSDVGIDVDVKKLQQQLHRWGISVIPKGASGKLVAQGPLLIPFNNTPSWQSKGMLALQISNLKNIGKQLLVDVPFGIALNNKQLQWHLDKGSHASLKKLQFNEMLIKSVAIKSATEIVCAYQIEKENWSCDPFVLQLTVPLIKNKQNSLTTSSGKLAFTSLAGTHSEWMASLGVELQDGIINVGDNKSVKQLRLDRLHGRVEASNQKVQAKLALVSPSSGATVNINVSHTMKNASGWVQYSLKPIDLQQKASVFSDAYSEWPTKLLLNAGIIEADGKLSWQQGEILPLPRATLTLKNVSGAHDEISFSGLSGTLDASGIDELRIKSRQNLNLASLNLGTPITEMTFQTEIYLRKGDKPKLTIDGLTMKVLGGKITGQRIDVDLDRDVNPFILQVSGVDVEQLLKLEQKQGLFGSGIIDGELPLVLTREGISMQDGQLVTRKPGGKLRYNANEGVQGMAESNAGLQLLVTAMKNFNYKLLELNVDYSPDGLLKMKVRLQGSNPELEGGRSVHLNVDVEDNILELLRSLRLASEIDEKIVEQVQKRQSGK